MEGGLDFGKMFGAVRRLCSLFPSMFLLAVQNDAMVANMWNWVREEGG